MKLLQTLRTTIFYRFANWVKLLLLLYVSIFTVVLLQAQVSENQAKHNEIQIWKGARVRPATEGLSGMLSITIDNNIASAVMGKHEVQTQIVDEQFVLNFDQAHNPRGQFHAFIDKDKMVHGHWLQPKLSIRASTKYASPVRFEKEGNNYQGEVIPLSDKLNVYLKLKKIAENRYSLDVFVPENNGGRYYNKSELVFQNTKVSIVRKNEDGEKVIGNGIFDLSEQKLTFYFPYWGGLYHFEKILDDKHFLLSSDDKSLYQIPVLLDDDWQVAHAKQHKINIDALLEFANERISQPSESALDAQLEALLVARDGKLVYEQYFRGFKQGQAHDMRSASKSLTGLLPGLLAYAQLNKAYPKQLNNLPKDILKTPVYRALNITDNVDGKQSIRLEHLLNMSSGLDCDDNDWESPGNENTMQNQQVQGDWQTYTLDLLQIHAPDKRPAYCSGGISLAGAVVTKASGYWVPKLIDDLFARPLGIKHYHINMQADGKKAYNGGGLQLSARDLLKMGQLLLNNGAWKGSQMLDPSYIQKVFSGQTELNGSAYSLGWWTRDYVVEDKTYKTHYASGNGGQHVFVVPELDLAVVFLSSSYNSAGSRVARSDWFPNVILQDVVQ